MQDKPTSNSVGDMTQFVKESLWDYCKEVSKHSNTSQTVMENIFTVRDFWCAGIDPVTCAKLIKLTTADLIKTDEKED